MIFSREGEVIEGMRKRYILDTRKTSSGNGGDDRVRLIVSIRSESWDSRINLLCRGVRESRSPDL